MYHFVRIQCNIVSYIHYCTTISCCGGLANFSFCLYFVQEC